MTQQTTDKLGFTQVWEGSPSDFIQIIDKWASVPRNLLKTDKGTESGSIALWVANEWIDWCYYRAKNEYIPLGEQVWRAEDSEAIRKKMTKEEIQTIRNEPSLKRLTDYRGGIVGS